MVAVEEAVLGNGNAVELEDGQRLQRLGDHDADLACCAAVDSLTVVPVQSEPGVLRSS